MIFRGISQYWRHWHYIDRGRGGSGGRPKRSDSPSVNKSVNTPQDILVSKYKSIGQIQRPAKSLATTSLFSISPIQIFNDQLELAEWCFSKQNAHSSMRSFNISNEFILSVIRNKFIAEKGALMLCEKCTNQSGQPSNQEHAILNYRGIT